MTKTPRSFRLSNDGELAADCSGDLQLLHSRRQRILELLILAFLSVASTIVAWRILPSWDDGSTWLMSLDGTSDIIRSSHADRPVFGAILQFFADRHVLWQSAFILHSLVWFGMGFVTRSLWKQLVPELPAFGLTAGCLAIAPAICRTQFVLLNPVVGGTIEPLLVYTALLMLWRLPSSAVAITVRCVVAAIAVAGASLVSEYALPAAVIGSALLIGWSLTDLNRVSRDRLIASMVLLVSALVGYLAYHRLASAEARPEVRPEVELASELGWRWKGIPLRTVSLTWQSSLGGALDRLGDLIVNSLPTALALACGIGLAFLLAKLAKNGLRNKPDENPSILSAQRFAVLLLALAAGLLPVAAMGRSVTSDPVTTRFLLPVLPAGACLAIFIMASIVRSRAAWIVPASVGLLTGFFIVSDGATAIAERNRMAAWSTQLEKLVPEPIGDGITVAIFNCDWRTDWQMPRDGELTARLTSSWSDAKRKHFWAFAELRQGREHKQALEGVDWDGKLTHPTLKTGRQEFVRQGPIERIIWVYVSNKDGSLDFRAEQPH